MHDYIERLEWLREYINACIDHDTVIGLHSYENKYYTMYAKFYASFVTKKGAGPLHPIRNFEEYIRYKKYQKLLSLGCCF